MSKSHLMGVAAAVACAGVMATAQAQQSPDQREHGAMKNQPVTLVGCLERQTATGDTAGRSTTPGQMERGTGTDQFVLTNAMMKSGSESGSPIGSSGTTAGGRAGESDTSNSTKATYKIEGLSAAKLKDHVGHKVEVTGRVDHSGMSHDRGSMGSTGSTDPTGGTGSTSPHDQMGRGASDTMSMAIQATNIKHVSESCSGNSDNQ